MLQNSKLFFPHLLDNFSTQLTCPAGDMDFFRGRKRLLPDRVPYLETPNHQFRLCLDSSFLPKLILFFHCTPSPRTSASFHISDGDQAGNMSSWRLRFISLRSVAPLVTPAEVNRSFVSSLTKSNFAFGFLPGEDLTGHPRHRESETGIIFCIQHGGRLCLQDFHSSFESFPRPPCKQGPLAVR